MFRMVRLEAKRSIALLLFLVVAALTRVFLWMDVQQWAASWTPLVHSMRGTAWIVLPVVLAAAIWHGGRERRAEVSELFAATPRPHRVRLLPAFLVFAGTAVLAVAAVVGWAAVVVAGNATFDGGEWPLGLAVGLLAAVAVTLVGLGVGRVAPAPVAAPLGAVMLFLALTFAQVRDDRPANRLVDTVLPMLPVTDDFHRVLPAFSVAQGIWFAGLGATGVLLAVAVTSRARALALAPAVAGVALGAVLAPSGAIVPAPAATALVCAPGDDRICVTQVHSRALQDLIAPARKVLEAFAEVPGGPKRVQEDQVSWMFDDGRPTAGADLDTVRVALPYRTREGGIRWEPEAVLSIVAQEATVDPGCFDGQEEQRRAFDASGAITAALLDTPTDKLSPAARQAYDTLRALPIEERRRRIGDGRRAGLTCGDPLAVVMGREAGR
ncbi:hypothetical protein PUR61_24345 [Streptomyces sp. BE20]|uniref:hypothetical protein n=1 Tax=Streptomyces sp. BE20 TaxID=3002525 RepID=UPI002E7732A4|nr:hypothetical protein [Streptomyces sp. BE20]MEE1825289.1 hypothetical protein [Streptomyces sp. BE20]